ncbi:thymidylate kinase [Streptomyces sp. NPDC051364]|uniref:dTMP kinase n=1 Tax=Streptomyces sp. NPDC051364 TaxID=3155799 RepID=UPI0034473041
MSVEGINGVGKTDAVVGTAAALGPRCLRLDEVTDKAGDTLPGQVVAALSADGDVFLRTGHPVAETLALLALKVREFEQLTAGDLAGVDVVLEDRGVDTTAVYQAVILAAQYPGTDMLALAERILTTTARWRPLPDATILLTGDRRLCTARFAARAERVFSALDQQMFAHAEALYLDLAGAHPERFTILDVTGYSREETAQALTQTVQNLLRTREAVHAP